MSTLKTSLVIALVDRLTAPSRGVARAMDGLQRAVERNNQALGRARGRMVDAVAAGYALSRGLGAPMRAAANFERQMALTGVAASATSDQFERLNKLARELGGSTSFTATQAGAAMEELAKAGIGTEDILGGATKAALAMSSATGAELASSAKLVAQMISSFQVPVAELDGVVTMAVGAMAKSRFDFEDIVQGFGQAAGVAAAAGVSYQDFLATLAGGADLFSSGSDAGTSFKNFLAFLPGKSDGAAALIKKLGLEFYDAAGNMKDMADIAQEWQDAIGGMSEKGATEALHEIMGTDATRTAIALSRMGRDGFRKLREEMEKTNVAAYEAARMGGFLGTVEKLAGALDDLMISLGTPFNATLGAAIDKVTPLIGALTKWTDAHPAVVSGVMSVVGSLVALRVASAAASFAFLFLRGGVLGLALGGLGLLSTAGLAAGVVIGGLAAGGVALYRNWAQVSAVTGRAAKGFGALVKRGAAAAKTFAGNAWRKAVDRVQAFGEALFPSKLSGGGGSDTLFGGAGSDLMGGADPLVSKMEAQLAAWAAGMDGARVRARNALKEAAAELHAGQLARTLRADRFLAKGAAAAQVANLGAATERVARAATAGSHRFQDLLTAVRRASEGTAFYTRQTTALGAATNLLNRAGGATVGVLQRMAAPLAPFVEAAAPFLRIAMRLNLIAQAALFVATHLAELKQFAIGIGEGFMSWMPTISADFEKLQGSVSDAAKTIGAAWDTVLKSFQSDTTWREFGDMIGQGFGFAVDVVVELADAFADVVKWSGDVFNSLWGIGAAFYSGDIVRYFQLLGAAAGDLSKFIGLDAAFDAMGEALKGLTKDVSAFVSDNALVRTLTQIATAAERVRAALAGEEVSSTDPVGDAAADKQRQDAIDGFLNPTPPGSGEAARPLGFIPGKSPAGAAEVAKLLGMDPPAVAAATAAWPEAAHKAMADYAAAIAAGGEGARTAAATLAATLQSILGITITPKVELQGVDAAIAKAQALKSELSSLSNFAPKAANANSPAAAIQARARGGPVARGMPYLVGEDGPELVSFGAKGTVHSARATAGLLARAGAGVPQPRGPLGPGRGAGGGGPTTVNVAGVHVTIEGGTSVPADELEERFSRSVSRAMRGAFSDGVV